MDDERDPESGLPINAKLANLANKRFSQQPSYAKIKDLQGEYPVPQNCDGVLVPRVNPEMWRRIAKNNNKHYKNRDLRFASIQKAIVAGAASVLQLLDAFTQASKAKGAPKVGSGMDGQLERLFKIGLHALTLLGHANYDLSLRRRDGMRPMLKPELADALCSSDNAVTKFLFGDDFGHLLKEAKQVSQMGHESSKRYPDYRRKNDSKNFRGPHNKGKWKSFKNKGHKDDNP